MNAKNAKDARDAKSTVGHGVVRGERPRSRSRLAPALGMAVTVALAGCDAQFGGAALSPVMAGAAAQTVLTGPEGDRYQYVGTNPFVTTEHDPLSTFAVDVDTASYDLFRRDVGEFGQLPRRESVRLEEYVNFFRYDYPSLPAGASEPFTVTVDGAPNPLSPTTVLRIGLHGKDAPTADPKPANLVFLVDVSGSMAATKKLPLVKTVMRETLDVLLAGSRVSIVTYASSPGVALPSTPVTDKETILHAIDQLAAGGSTNGAGGIDAAYAQAEAHLLDDGVNHVVLCTDGDFNVGASSDQALVDLITEKRKTGVTLTALGFGAGNLNDAMMELVSNAGNGFYSVIATEDQAVDYAHDRLLATLYIIARDVKVQVAFNPARVAAYRLLGYEDRALEDNEFLIDTVDAGEIGAGHTVTALYELVLAGGEIPAPEGAPAVEGGPPVEASGELAAHPVTGDALCEVRLRYKAADATEDDAASQWTVAVTPEMLADSMDDAPADLRWALGVAAFAELLKESPFASVDNLDAIAQLTAAQGEGAGGEGASPLDSDPDRQEFRALFAAARVMLATP